MHLIEFQHDREPRQSWAYLMSGFSRDGLTGLAAVESSARQLLDELRERHGERVAVFLDGRRIRALKERAVAEQSPDAAGEGSSGPVTTASADGASSPPPPIQTAGIISSNLIAQ